MEICREEACEDHCLARGRAWGRLRKRGANGGRGHGKAWVGLLVWAEVDSGTNAPACAGPGGKECARAAWTEGGASGKALATGLQLEARLVQCVGEHLRSRHGAESLHFAASCRVRKCCSPPPDESVHMTSFAFMQRDDFRLQYPLPTMGANIDDG